MTCDPLKKMLKEKNVDTRLCFSGQVSVSVFLANDQWTRQDRHRRLEGTHTVKTLLPGNWHRQVVLAGGG